MVHSALQGLQAVRWLTFSNGASGGGGGGAVPPFSCLQIAGLAPQADTVFLTARQFDGTGTGVFAFSGPGPVAAGAQGSCTMDYPAIVTYDSSATPAVGDTWTAKSGQYSLTKGSAGAANGFLVVGPIDTTRQTMWVVPNGAASMAVVQIDTTNSVYTGSGSPTAGQLVTARSDGTFSGVLQSLTPGTSSFRTGSPWTAGASCWLAFVDAVGGSADLTLLPTAVCGDQYVATPLGTYNSRPLYACRRGRGKARIVWGACGTKAAGSNGTVTVSGYADGASPGTSITAADPGSLFTVASGSTKACTCIYRPETDDYIITVMGC